MSMEILGYICLTINFYLILPKNTCTFERHSELVPCTSTFPVITKAWKCCWEIPKKRNYSHSRSSLTHKWKILVYKKTTILGPMIIKLSNEYIFLTTWKTLWELFSIQVYKLSLRTIYKGTAISFINVWLWQLICFSLVLEKQCLEAIK